MKNKSQSTSQQATNAPSETGSVDDFLFSEMLSELETLKTKVETFEDSQTHYLFLVNFDFIIDHDSNERYRFLDWMVLSQTEYYEWQQKKRCRLTPEEDGEFFIKHAEGHPSYNRMFEQTLQWLLEENLVQRFPIPKVTAAVLSRLHVGTVNYFDPAKWTK